MITYCFEKLLKCPWFIKNFIINSYRIFTLMFIVMKNYVTIQELMDIYSLSPNVIGEILKRYKIDSYKGKRWLVVNFHDFHKLYTSKYNPTLFSFEQKKVVKKEKIIEKTRITFWDNNSLLAWIFSNPCRSVKIFIQKAVLK